MIELHDRSDVTIEFCKTSPQVISMTSIVEKEREQIMFLFLSLLRLLCSIYLVLFYIFLKLSYLFKHNLNDLSGVSLC